MITGDHPATALAVAHQIGIPGGGVLTGEDLDGYQGRRSTDALRRRERLRARPAGAEAAARRDCCRRRARSSR